MGGIGSGAYLRWGTRSTTDDMLALPIGKLAGDGWLEVGRTCSFTWSRAGRSIGDIKVTAGHGHVVLSCRSRSGGSDWRDMSYAVQIERTLCRLGGGRPWFLCPARGCGRRVGTLYGGAVFACRHCHKLAYPSENESRNDRAARRAEKLRARLGWPAGIFNGSGWGRPKGMHRATYRRLVKEYDEREARALSGIMVWLDLLKKR